MAEQTTCPQCGTPVAADAPHGLCPGCLLLAAADPDAAATGSARDHAPATAKHAGGTPLTRHPPGRLTAPTLDELAPRFPQLELLALIGKGGMGAVYKARQRALDRVVALKVLPPEAGRDPTFAARFQREARAMARLTHPHIVMVIDFGEADGLYYLLMEYVDGVNLREAMRSGELSAEQALAIVPQICDALQYAHDEGIVHRDIKPENVLLDKRGRVKIADFGLAKLLHTSATDVTLTATHQVLGTLRYMAPEQIEHPLEVDHRADIYSLGVVFYELLTGDVPVGRFPLPSEQRPVDARLDNVVLKALERRPDERYQHASDVKTDVERISADRPAALPIPPPVTRAPVTTAAGDSRASAELDSEPTWVRVPFTVQQVYGGLATAYGIVRTDGRQLQFEFEIKDEFFGSIKSGVKQAAFPLERVLWLKLRPGIFHDRLCIQTDYLAAVSEVPNSDRGLVTLHLRRSDRELAEAFVDRARGGAGATSAPSETGSAAREPAGGDRSASSEGAALAEWQAGQLDEVRRRLRAPAIALSAAGLLTLLPAVLLAALTLAQLLFAGDLRFGPGEPGGSSLEVMPVISLWILFGALGVIPGTGLLVAGINAAGMGPRPLIVCGAVVGMLPLSPLWIVNAPIAIWSVVEVLGRRTNDAYRGRREARRRGIPLGRAELEKPLSEAQIRHAQVRLRAVAIGLLAAATLSGTLLVGLLGLSVADLYGNLPRPVTLPLLAVLAGSAACCLGILFGAAQMALFLSHGGARLACVLAVLPCTPAWLLSAPLGIYGLIQLNDPKHRALFP